MGPTRLRRVRQPDGLVPWRGRASPWRASNVECGKFGSPGGRASPLFLDEADVAAAFDAADSDFRKALCPGLQPQIFFEIVFGNVISPHHRQNHLAIFYDHFSFSFN